MVYPTVTELPPGRRHRDAVRFCTSCLTQEGPPHPAPRRAMTAEQASGFVDSFLITRYGHTLADAPTGRVRN